METQKTLALAEITAAHHGQQVQIQAMITDRRQIVANKHETICVLALQDHTGSLQALVAPPLYDPSSLLYESGNEVVLSGKVEVRRTTITILCSALGPAHTQQGIFDQEQALTAYTRLMEAGPLAENEQALQSLIEQAYAQGLYFDYDRDLGGYRLVSPTE